jgi:hypothetical protein
MSIALEDFHIDLVSQLQLINPSISIPIIKETKEETDVKSLHGKPSLSKNEIISPIKELQNNIIVSLQENYPNLIVPDQTFLLSLENKLILKLFPNPNNNCSQILVSGKNKGRECSKKAKINSLCSMHNKKFLSQKINTPSD